MKSGAFEVKEGLMMRGNHQRSLKISAWNLIKETEAALTSSAQHDASVKKTNPRPFLSLLLIFIHKGAIDVLASPSLGNGPAAIISDSRLLLTEMSMHFHGESAAAGALGSDREWRSSPTEQTRVSAQRLIQELGRAMCDQQTRIDTKLRWHAQKNDTLISSLTY